jgi:hypothetical protein
MSLCFLSRSFPLPQAFLPILHSFIMNLMAALGAYCFFEKKLALLHAIRDF